VEQKKNELSILIPVYNTVCVGFVRQLQAIADKTGIVYEIIVADDASTDRTCVEQNSQLNQLEHCLYIIKEVNTGAAATRNFLARQSRYPWLLFLDCDMQLPGTQLLTRYLAALDAPVVMGGISFGGDPKQLRSNLRYRYETTEAQNHTAERRQQRPYQSFRSCNFLISRETMLCCPFDERFKASGYEDVMFGKQLKTARIGIAHIDNPVLMTDYEANEDYVAKVERSLNTLYDFRRDLQGYSRLLTLADGIHIGLVRRCITLLHKLFGGMIRRSLCGQHPSLTAFKLYKLGYYLSIKK
jgi:glycosyltransferase involved in cell wall biosynthesis